MLPFATTSFENVSFFVKIDGMASTAQNEDFKKTFGGGHRKFNVDRVGLTVYIARYNNI